MLMSCTNADVTQKVQKGFTQHKIPSAYIMHIGSRQNRDSSADVIQMGSRQLPLMLMPCSLDTTLRSRIKK